MNFKALISTSFLLVLMFLSLNAQNAWINEIHYDNTGTDQGEFIEVVIQNASTYNLGQFKITLYNGNNGGSYDTDSLSTFTQGSTYGSYTLFYFTYPSNGIQNGGTATSPAPDGMALSYQGVVISGQYLSYEGVMAAVDGPAAGMTSTDIGVSQDGTNAIGTSLQLSGTGTSYSQFTWQSPATATPGTLNNNQSIGTFVPDPEPSNHATAFTASVSGLSITLDWTDATGTQLPSGYLVLASTTPGFVSPTDTVPVADDLNLSDGNGAKNVLYGVETFTFSGLNGSTTYYFAVYPYTNSGASINYKTSIPVPQANATTSAVINQINFNSNNFGLWDTVSIASDKNWFIDSFNNDFFAKASGYQGNVPSDDWLISPALPLDNYSNEVLSFISAKNYAGPDLEVLISTNYTGNGIPGSATWTPLSATLSAGSWAWTPSGSISLSAYTGVAYIAFHYTSTATDAATWEVDNIVITGNSTATMNVTLNELLADNEMAYMDPSDNEYDDWIELYNPSNVAINLEDWSLTDDPSSTERWYFPDTTIQALSFLIVWADEDTLDPGLHANFSLSKNGEQVFMYNATGQRIDSVFFTAQYEDTTYARIPDGFGNWFFAMPTPMAHNALFPVIVIDSVPPVLVSAYASSATEVIVVFNEPVGVSAEVTSNYTGLGSIQSAVRNANLTQVTLTLATALTSGQVYNLVISSIADTTGNVMTIPYYTYIAFGNITADLVITEIMYNPPEVGIDSLEYIEIYNNGTSAVPLQNFYFSEGISFTFPAAVIQPGEYYVIGNNAQALINTLGAVNVFQWSSGSLSNTSEDLVLKSPAGITIDSLEYGDAAPWPTAPDGFGPSLVLCDPSMDNTNPANWSASVEYAGMNAAGDSIFGTPGQACDPSGIAEWNNAFDWSYYPVPAGKEIFLRLPQGEWSISLTDLSGRIQLKQQMVRSGESLELPDVSTGLYLMQVYSAEGQIVAVAKVMIKQ